MNAIKVSKHRDTKMDAVWIMLKHLLREMKGDGGCVDDAEMSRERRERCWMLCG